MTSRVFDVVVVGGGPAGEVLAGRCGDRGLRVALVERELVGGECSYWACMPSKMLLRPGEALAAARRVAGAREAIGGRLDATAALRRRDEITGGWDDASQVRWLEAHHVELVRGEGRIAAPQIVAVTARDGSVARLEARRAVVIATGSSPKIPPIAGLDESSFWSNREATASETVPSRLLVLGGGPVGVELAQAWKRLGAARVVLVEAADRLLPSEEPFAGEELAAAFRSEAIEVELGRTISRIRRVGSESFTATLDDRREIDADQLLVAIGRQANTTNLGVEVLGLQPGAPIAVDDQLRVTGVDGDWLYAVGDVNGRALFTHMGKYQARIAADHIAGVRSERALADHRAVPRVVFTDPQIASVGWTEAEAQKRGVRTKRLQFPTGNVAGAVIHADGFRGTSQLVIDSDRHVLVGATFTGPEVAELLHAATIAIAGEVPLERLWHAVPAFPTVSEVWLRLLESEEGKS